MNFKNTVVVASPATSTIEVVKEMAESKVYFKGLAIILDEFSKVQGVFNDGDLIRLIGQGNSLDGPIAKVMTPNPIVVQHHLSNIEIITEVQQQLLKRGVDTDALRDVIVVDEEGKLQNVLSYVSLMSSARDARKNVAVYGQGFVGITLSAALANLGHKVYGVDVQESLIKRLKDNDVHVFEPRLNDIVAATQEGGSLEFTTGLAEEKVDYYIVAVGTPVNDEGIANLAALDAVTQSIGKRLKRGDVVMLRSTVPVGTTRNVVREILEEASGLEAGVDFHLAFAPERTAEGKAMEELRSLPQIVGGLSSLCAKRSIELWSSLTDSVVQVDSLEAAELVKLINNSFRDLSFAFANSVALLGDRFNINAFKLINAANEGYPRNRIPLPSPGVGGYCLTKDPFLFASVDKNSGHAKLAVNGRMVNEEAQSYALKQVTRYLNRVGKEITDARIFIVGLAFKGWPETNDLRGSSSIFIAQELQKMGATVVGYDNVVPYEDWQTFLPKVQLGSLEADLSESDVVLVMNNHPKNIPSNFLSLIKKGTAKMVFDGWSMLDSNAFKSIDMVDYATMGYISIEM